MNSILWCFITKSFISTTRTFVPRKLRYKNKSNVNVIKICFDRGFLGKSCFIRQILLTVTQMRIQDFVKGVPASEAKRC